MLAGSIGDSATVREAYHVAFIDLECAQLGSEVKPKALFCRLAGLHHVSLTMLFFFGRMPGFH